MVHQVVAVTTLVEAISIVQCGHSLAAISATKIIPVIAIVVGKRFESVLVVNQTTAVSVPKTDIMRFSFVKANRDFVLDVFSVNRRTQNA